MELINYLKAKARTSTARPVADRALHEFEEAWGEVFPGTSSPIQLKLDASDRAALQQRLQEFDDAATRLKLTPQGRGRLWRTLLTWWENDCLNADYAPTPVVFIRRPMNVRAVLRATLPYPAALVAGVLNGSTIVNHHDS